MAADPESGLLKPGPKHAAAMREFSEMTAALAEIRGHTAPPAAHRPIDLVSPAARALQKQIREAEKDPALRDAGDPGHVEAVRLLSQGRALELSTHGPGRGFNRRCHRPANTVCSRPCRSQSPSKASPTGWKCVRCPTLVWQLEARWPGGFWLVAHAGSEEALRRRLYEEGVELERATMECVIFERLMKEGRAETIR